MKLKLTALSGEKLNEDVYEIQIPTESGEISIFDDHEPLVTIAVPGVLEVRRHKADSDAQKVIYAINGGAVHIVDNTVTVLVDEADHADDIVAEEAEAALMRARQQREGAKDMVSITEAEALMNRAAVRLKVANLRRRYR